MKKIIGPIALVIFLALLSSGVIGNAIDFFTWLFVLDYSQPSLSIAGEIIVRVITFLVSYSLVGLVFDFFGWYNRAAMKILYFIVSSLAGFVLAYVVWTIEQYIVIISIILGVILLHAVAGIILVNVFKKKKDSKTSIEDQD